MARSSTDLLTRVSERLVGQAAEREIIPRDPRSSVRWHVHDYPSPLSRWNHHPELEVHLIRSSSGRYIVGDAIGRFGPGQIVLIGPDLPHHWISDVAPGEVVTGRDMVMQFDLEWLRTCQAAFPELDRLDPLLADAARGIEFRGPAGEAAAAALETVGESTGPARVAAIMRLFDVLAGAPEDQRRLLASAWYRVPGDAYLGMVAEKVMRHVVENLADELRLGDVAAELGIPLPSLSKAFKRASGMTFSEVVRRLRISQACRLLELGDRTIAAIAHDVGYSNIANFNRQFLRETGATPSAYRSRARAAGAA